MGVIRTEGKIILAYAQYLNPYVNVKKAWLELDEQFGYKLCCLYDGFYDNEMNYTYLQSFDREEVINEKMKIIQ